VATGTKVLLALLLGLVSQGRAQMVLTPSPNVSLAKSSSSGSGTVSQTVAYASKLAGVTPGSASPPVALHRRRLTHPRRLIPRSHRVTLS
jgi:hypothetical protein